MWGGLTSIKDMLTMTLVFGFIAGCIITLLCEGILDTCWNSIKETQQNNKASQ